MQLSETTDVEVALAHQTTMRTFLESQNHVFSRLLFPAEAVLPAPAQPEALVSPDPAPAPVPVAAMPAPKMGKRRLLGRYAMVSKAQSAVPNTGRLKGLFLLTGGLKEITAPIAQAIADAGGICEVIKPKSLTDKAKLAEKVAALQAQHGSICGLIHAVGLGLKEMPADLEAWRNLNAEDSKGLFFLLQICAADLRKNAGKVLALSAMGGGFGRYGGTWQSLPTSGGAVGLLKTVAIEWPEIVARAVDYNGIQADVLASSVVAELVCADTAPEIGYVYGQRRVFDAILEPLTNRNDKITRWHANPDWVVLVTGGARGITSEVLDEILLPGMTVILVGRAAEPAPEEEWSSGALSVNDLRKQIILRAKEKGETLTPSKVEKEISAIQRDRAIRSNLESFRHAGANLEYFSADVRDLQQMKSIMDSVYARHGRIDAIIHGAGIIEDKLLVDKGFESFERVYDTKVDSAFVLSQCIQPQTLKWLGFFTSVAGRTGNRGQCDYAAANELVNRFAWWLHYQWPKVKITAINWGPWESGMASAEVNKQFEDRGVFPIPPKLGKRYFRQEMLSDVNVTLETVAVMYEEEGPIHTPYLALVKDRVIPVKNEQAECEFTFSLALHPFLDTHRIDDKAVVASALCMEVMAEAVQTAWQGWKVAEVADFRQLRGITLENDEDITVKLIMKTVSSSADALEIQTGIASASNDKLLFYRAIIKLVKTLPESPTAPVYRTVTPKSIPSRFFYTQYFHGKHWRLLEDISALDQTGVDGVVRVPMMDEWLQGEENKAQWIIGPGVLDAALQSGFFWINPVYFALPTRFARVVLYREGLPAGESLRMVCRATSQTAVAIIGDVYLIDSQGYVRLSAEGMEMTISKALMRLATQGPLI